jgi:hypothetical protein
MGAIDMPEDTVSATRAAIVAFIAIAIVGGLGLVFQQPLLFPSIGPTVFLHTVSPKQSTARAWNTFVGHAIGAVAAFGALALFGGQHMPSAMTAGSIEPPRIYASALAVGLTIAFQLPMRAVHAPAAATTLLITLGGLQADWATIAVLVAGIASSTVLCDWGLRISYRR